MEEIKIVTALVIGVWVVVKLRRGNATTIWQGKTSHGANSALFKHINESGERIITHHSENDEFGKGQSVVTRDATQGETFYTTGKL